MPSVFPEWMSDLSMQQQSVLVLAARGPDGVTKHHPCKHVQRAYRASVLKAAYFGRDMEHGESADTFMAFDVFFDADNPYHLTWSEAVRLFFDSVDEIPHHFYMHLMHGAQILGYKHPWMNVRSRWRMFYLMCCDDLHVMPENEEAMDKRLNDWGREWWGNK